MSRIDARKATRKEKAPITAIISITDYGSKRNSFYEQPWLKAVLEIQFDDVIEGENGCITYCQAVEIANFVLGVHKHVERYIVHCEYGQSRSAGIAAAISKYFEGHDSGIFNNKTYFPNPACYRYVLRALCKRGRIPQFLR